MKTKKTVEKNIKKRNKENGMLYKETNKAMNMIKKTASATGVVYKKLGTSAAKRTIKRKPGLGDVYGINSSKPTFSAKRVGYGVLGGGALLGGYTLAN